MSKTEWLVDPPRGSEWQMRVFDNRLEADRYAAICPPHTRVVEHCTKANMTERPAPSTEALALAGRWPWIDTVKFAHDIDALCEQRVSVEVRAERVRCFEATLSREGEAWSREAHDTANLIRNRMCAAAGQPGCSDQEERVARALADVHFRRKQHVGWCTQDERVAYLVNTYWRNSLPDARAAIAAMSPTDAGGLSSPAPSPSSSRS
jgi:hypothetical protein